jgi:Zn-dependent protease
MKWSFLIARVFGIDIKIHATFVFALAIGALWGAEHGQKGVAFGLLFTILLFACVVLHELGHSLVAKFFKIPVREIVLLPIGGVAQMEKNPEKPVHELLIALSGPLVNVVIAAGIYLAFGKTLLAGIDPRAMMTAQNLQPSAQTLVFWLLTANVTLATFNMIPAFPLDGGRVLRAILAMFMGFSQGTAVAAVIGQFIAVFLGIFAVVTGQMLLALVAFFIFMGAGRERAEEQARTVLHTLRVGDAYNRYALTLAPGDHVSRVVDYILTSYQPDFAVLQGSQLIGVITRQDVLRVLATDIRDLYVAGVMNRNVEKVQSTESLDDVRKKMEKGEIRLVSVYEGERYLGLVSLEDIAEALLVSTFVERQNQLRKAAETA